MGEGVLEGHSVQAFPHRKAPDLFAEVGKTGSRAPSGVHNDTFRKLFTGTARIAPNMTAFAHFPVLPLLGMLQARKETSSIVAKTKIKYPNEVRQYRERLCFTQDQLACIVGCRSDRRIRRIENGEVMPGSLTVLRLSAALRVPVDYLYAATINQLRVEVHAIEERMPKGRQGVLPLPA